MAKAQTLTDEECEAIVTGLIKRHCSNDRVRLLEWLAERTALYQAFTELEVKAGLRSA